MRDLSEPTLAFCSSTLGCHSYWSLVRAVLLRLISGSSCAVAVKFACRAEDEVESWTAKRTNRPRDAVLHNYPLGHLVDPQLPLLHVAQEDHRPRDAFIHDHPRRRLVKPQLPLLRVALEQTPTFSPINSPKVLWPTSWTSFATIHRVNLTCFRYAPSHLQSQKVCRNWLPCTRQSSWEWKRKEILQEVRETQTSKEAKGRDKCVLSKCIV